MNHLYVFAVCLSAPSLIVARSASDSAAVGAQRTQRSPSAEACSGNAKGNDDLAGGVGDMEVSLMQTGFAVHQAAKTTLHEWMAESSRQAAPQTPATGGSASLYWVRLEARALALLQQATDRTGNAAVGILILLIVLGVVLILLLAALTSPAQQEWEISSAQDLLDKPGAPAQDPRLPGQFQAAMPPKPPLPPPTNEPSEVTPALGGIGSLLSSLSSLGGTVAQIPKASTVRAPMVMIPEMLVQEPEGVQFFIDGVLTPGEQSGFIEVWRVSADLGHRAVLKIALSEGRKGVESNQKGISVELPGNLPITFLNTSFASHPPSGAYSSFSRNRHITMFDILSTGQLDLASPFAIIEREAAGITLRRMSGEVMCIVASGGYNTDFGNIVDEDGRLIATLSNRGHSLTGLGMVRGDWTENRRVVQIAQGIDVLVIICAIISATKLA